MRALVGLAMCAACSGGPAAPAPAGGTPRGSYPVGSGPRAVAAADLAADGDLDLVTANGDSGDATIRWNDGGSLLAAGPPLAAGHQPSDVAAADLDGDGDIDLVFANHDTPLVTVLAGDGAGGFEPL